MFILIALIILSLYFKSGMWARHMQLLIESFDKKDK